MSRRRTSLPESAGIPPAIRVANSLLRLSGDRAARSLTVEALLESARRQTGLEDFGPGDVETPLRVLLESVRAEAELSPLGCMVTRTRLLGVLANRLRSEYWYSRHPEILGQNLDPPILITGLQRTGTTLLQRLLAADRRVRSLSSWEALNPAPRLPRRRTALERVDGTPVRDAGKDPRVKSALVAQRALKLLAPEFFIIHPVEFDGPEEEVLLLDSALVSTVPEALMYVPTFSRWAEEQDQAPSYDRMVKLLKLLQWQERREYWVLKSPHHLEWPGYIDAHLPHARIIMTHRDPVVATSSFFSMVWHSNQLLSARTPPERLARHWFAKTRRMMSRFLAHRDAAAGTGGPMDRIQDVSYYDLVSDPIGVIRKVYAGFGMEFTAETETRMREVLRNHAQSKYGVHRYHLESFGISRDESEEAFADYRNRFAIRREETK